MSEIRACGRGLVAASAALAAALAVEAALAAVVALATPFVF